MNQAVSTETIMMESEIFRQISYLFDQPTKRLVPILAKLKQLHENDIDIAEILDHMINIQNYNDAELLAVQVDHAKLFIGPFEVLAPLYAELYLGKTDQVNGQITKEITDIYCEYGVVDSEAKKELPDHIAYELEFMYYLGYQFVKTADKKFLVMYENFYQQFIVSWLPVLIDKIAKNATSMFYKQLAVYLNRVFVI